MDPFSIGLGALGIGSSLLGGIGANRTAASIAGAQLKAADAARRDAIILGREQAKGQFAENAAGRYAGLVWGPDLEQFRQFQAMGQMLGPFAEKETAIRSERGRRDLALQNSPAYREAAQRENELAIQRAQAERRAVTDAMFGRTSSSFFR